MRVGLVCPYDMTAPGGVQELVTQLADHLRGLGDEVVVVGGGEPGESHPGVGVGRSVGVKGNRSTAPVTLSPSAWPRVRSALADVDVVHVHEPLIPLIGWAALAVDRPGVATFHADAPRWVRPVYRWAPGLGPRMRRMKLTAVSETAARAVPASWGHVGIVPNAVDVGSFDLDVQRAPGRVAFLGRDEPRKGLDVLLRAWPAISGAVPHAELVVMGADRGVPPPGVTFLGRVSGDEKRRVLASSAVCVAPNTGGESFGIVIAEAMAAGCAVAASDLPAFTAVVGDAGRVFPAGDAGALAETVTGLLGDEEAVRSLGESARRRVRRFDWGVVAPEYRAVYRDAVAS